MSPRFTTNKEAAKKLKLLKIALETNSTSEAIMEAIKAWEEKHGELIVPEKQ
ncbi:MAG: hypothetical protein ACE5OZ_19110 [Candidatus Heimdallarchaeota archaeon]